MADVVVKGPGGVLKRIRPEELGYWQKQGFSLSHVITPPAPHSVEYTRGTPINLGAVVDAAAGFGRNFGTGWSKYSSAPIDPLPIAQRTPVASVPQPTLNPRQYTPYISQTSATPATPAMTPTEQMAAARAREALAKQKAASPGPRIIAARPATKAVKPGATASTRGRVVDRPAVSGGGAAGVGLSPSTRMTYQQMMAASGYRPASAQAPGLTYQQMMARSGYSPNAPAPAMAAAPPAFDPALMAGVADYIATATPTAPVSPYATMNQYMGTSGPPAISVQNSQQAAATAARNATADQLASAEFRATLDQLLREAGLPSQFGTPDAQLALRDYRP